MLLHPGTLGSLHLDYHCSHESGVGYQGDFLPLSGSVLLPLPSLPFPSIPAFRSLVLKKGEGWVWGERLVWGEGGTAKTIETLR